MLSKWWLLFLCFKRQYIFHWWPRMFPNAEKNVSNFKSVFIFFRKNGFHPISWVFITMVRNNECHQKILPSLDSSCNSIVHKRLNVNLQPCSKIYKKRLKIWKLHNNIWGLRRMENGCLTRVPQLPARRSCIMRNNDAMVTYLAGLTLSNKSLDDSLIMSFFNSVLNMMLGVMMINVMHIRRPTSTE